MIPRLWMAELEPGAHPWGDDQEPQRTPRGQEDRVSVGASYGLSCVFGHHGTGATGRNEHVCQSLAACPVRASAGTHQS